MSAEIQAVVFDMGDTLVEFPPFEELIPAGFEYAYDQIASAQALDSIECREFVSALMEEETLAWKRLGKSPSNECLGAVITRALDNLGVGQGTDSARAIEDAFYEYVWSAPTPLADASSTLRDLQRLGIRLALISNTLWQSRTHERHLERDGLLHYFEHRAFSSSKPWAKPHPSIFLETLTLLGVGPEQAIFVGDRPPDDIKGALDVGMFAVLKHSKHSDLAGPKPHAEISSLSEIVNLVLAPSGLK